MLLIGLSACGAERNNFGEFSQYVYEFQLQSQKRGKFITEFRLDIRFDDRLTGNTMAECTHGGLSTPTIRVNPLYWNNEPDASRELLMFHELAHCLPPFKGHIDNRFDIMNSYQCEYSRVNPDGNIVSDIKTTPLTENTI